MNEVEKVAFGEIKKKLEKEHSPVEVFITVSKYKDIKKIYLYVRSHFYQITLRIRKLAEDKYLLDKLVHKRIGLLTDFSTYSDDPPITLKELISRILYTIDETYNRKSYEPKLIVADEEKLKIMKGIVKEIEKDPEFNHEYFTDPTIPINNIPNIERANKTPIKVETQDPLVRPVTSFKSTDPDLINVRPKTASKFPTKDSQLNRPQTTTPIVKISFPNGEKRIDNLGDLNELYNSRDIVLRSVATEYFKTLVEKYKECDDHIKEYNDRIDKYKEIKQKIDNISTYFQSNNNIPNIGSKIEKLEKKFLSIIK